MFTPKLETLTNQDAQEKARKTTRGRLLIAGAAIFAFYGLIAGRLVMLGVMEPNESSGYFAQETGLAAARPDIVDRNGHILATDIRTPSLYAEPRKLIDADEATEKLMEVLPDLDRASLHKKLSSRRAFAWIARELTPAQRDQIHALGLPGIGFRHESRRVYPNGELASHILGHVDVDNRGIAGMEKSLDRNGLKDLIGAGFALDTDLTPVDLTIDMGVQHVVSAELAKAMETYSAKAAMGVVMKANTGEVVAMVSLPEYDPNDPKTALDPNRMNRVSAGVFELGSTFKAFTTAMALDSGLVRMTDTFDARNPIRVGGQTISDFHAQRRIMDVADVFVHSSNIGTAKMALAVGIERQQAFLRTLGLLDRLDTELPESASPLYPSRWSTVSAMTISFGHGISVTPLQATAAAASMVNGGYLIPPTFRPRTEEEAAGLRKQVIRAETSQMMRYLMRLNVVSGTAKKAEADGYRVGGKTGTAEKVVNGRYSNTKVLTSFMGAFPSDNPEYVIMIVLDEPQGTKDTHGYRTSGWNAAPVTGAIVARIAPMLKVTPQFFAKPEEEPILARY